jgi:pimeloyl-ACP methyl ester carboxylesterase
MPDGTVRKAIIIGFVGGFVRRDDANHPEVQFAAYLRERYPSGVHAEVFANHEGQQAQRYVLSLLDTDGNGVLTAMEKEQANVIIYGHSWGASQTVTLARELGRQGIPVLLTIQVDSIAKPGQKDSTISPNVARAINFYQPRGLIHGRSTIVAADPTRTKILGNFRMTYRDRRINCDNYQWFVRVFNKPHHEIENDPRVWDQAAGLIDSELSSATSTIQASALK